MSNPAQPLALCPTCAQKDKPCLPDGGGEVEREGLSGSAPSALSSRPQPGRAVLGERVLSE